MVQVTPPAAPGPHEMTVVAAIVGGMGHGTTLDFDLATLRRAIGGGSFVRGTEYARQQAVLRVDWDPDGSALRGMVQGQGGHVYRTAAFLTLAPGQPAKFDMGDCSCPVSFNCKHVVALVMTAVGSGTIEPRPRPGPRPGPVPGLAAGPGPPARATPQHPGHRAGPDRRGGPGHWGGPAPLGLTARLVRPGRAGWVTGDLSWARLDTLRLGSAHNDQQVCCCASCTRSTRPPATTAACRLRLGPGPHHRVLGHRLPPALAAAGRGPRGRGGPGPARPGRRAARLRRGRLLPGRDP